MNKEELLHHDEMTRYMLLSRMQQDCEYYLGWGYRNTGRLWAGNERDQIEAMRLLYDSFEQKPEWITPADIDTYEERMINENMIMKAVFEFVNEKGKTEYLIVDDVETASQQYPLKEYARVNDEHARAELQGKPRFEGFLGPMWNDGELRYEAEEVYRHMSQ